MQVDDPLLTSQDLADYLRIPLQTIYVWQSAGAARTASKSAGTAGTG